MAEPKNRHQSQKSGISQAPVLTCNKMNQGSLGSGLRPPFFGRLVLNISFMMMRRNSNFLSKQSRQWIQLRSNIPAHWFKHNLYLNFLIFCLTGQKRTGVCDFHPTSKHWTIRPLEIAYYVTLDWLPRHTPPRKIPLCPFNHAKSFSALECFDIVVLNPFSPFYLEPTVSPQ